jgi:hypothetical protein
MIGLDVGETESESGMSVTMDACGAELPGIIARAATATTPKTIMGKITLRFNYSKLFVKIIKKLSQFETKF